MDKIKEIETAEPQIRFFNSYLERFGIDSGSESAQNLLTEISSGNMSTFKDNKLKLRDGTEIVTTTLLLDDGAFKRNPSMLEEQAEIKIFEDLAALGFEQVSFWDSANSTLIKSGVFVGKGIGVHN